MEKVRIKADVQETTCHGCGYPLYVGESAVQQDGWLYCSESCGEKAPLELLKGAQTWDNA